MSDTSCSGLKWKSEKTFTLKKKRKKIESVYFKPAIQSKILFYSNLFTLSFLFWPSCSNLFVLNGLFWLCYFVVLAFLFWPSYHDHHTLTFVFWPFSLWPSCSDLPILTEQKSEYISQNTNIMIERVAS